MRNSNQNFLLSCILFLSLLLSACTGILPGMKNPDISNMPRLQEPDVVKVKPVVIPINASFLTSNPMPYHLYRVAPQDILSIIVWQHPEFNPVLQQTATTSTQSSQAAGQSGYLVNENGKIYFPLVGYVTVAGKTQDEIRNELTIRLRAYVRNPQLVVRVADYRSKKIYVLGEVFKPSVLPLNDQRMTIADALMLTGSIDPISADPRHIYIIRGYFTRPNIYWLDANTPDAMLLAEHFELQSGDVLYVSSAAVTRWNRFLNHLLPTLQTIWYTKTLTNS